MKRLLIGGYGLFAYAVFLAVLAAFVGFVEGIGLPRSIDAGPSAPPLAAALVDLGLIALFGVQHSAMARAGFKRAFARALPEAAQRSTYVLAASILLALLMAAWRPLPAVVFSVSSPPLRMALLGLSLAGVLIVLLSSFLIDHFEFGGLRQSLGMRPLPDEFRVAALYRIVRHPLYLGLLIAFWSAPVYSVGRLLFAAAFTLYIVIGATLEERDLMRAFGEKYARYRERVAMLIPFVR